MVLSLKLEGDKVPSVTTKFLSLVEHSLLGPHLGPIPLGHSRAKIVRLRDEVDGNRDRRQGRKPPSSGRGQCVSLDSMKSKEEDRRRDCSEKRWGSFFYSTWTYTSSFVSSGKRKRCYFFRGEDRKSVREWDRPSIGGGGVVLSGRKSGSSLRIDYCD